MFSLKSQAFKWLGVLRPQEFTSVSDTDWDQDPYSQI